MPRLYISEALCKGLQKSEGRMITEQGWPDETEIFTSWQFRVATTEGRC